MVKSSIKEIHETLKTMLSYAIALSDSQVATVYELGHYLADNILIKVFLAVAIENGEEQQTYTITKSGKRRTKNFDELYKKFLKKFYPKIPNYDPDIKDFHEERNIYQHDVESFDMTMRQPRAKSYVELVERIMRMVGIIKVDEIIHPTKLLTSMGAYDFTKRQIKIKDTKYQKLHDLFKKKYDDDIHIEFEHAINAISSSDLKKTLKMEGGKSHGMWSLHNSKWDIQISRYGVGVHRGKNGKGYSLDEPNKNTDVLKDFLEYFREYCEKFGIDIKP